MQTASARYYNPIFLRDGVFVSLIYKHNGVDGFGQIQLFSLPFPGPEFSNVKQTATKSKATEVGGS